MMPPLAIVVAITFVSCAACSPLADIAPAQSVSEPSVIYDRDGPPIKRRSPQEKRKIEEMSEQLDAFRDTLDWLLRYQGASGVPPDGQ